MYAHIAFADARQPAFRRELLVAEGEAFHDFRALLVGGALGGDDDDAGDELLARADAMTWQDSWFGFLEAQAAALRIPPDSPLRPQAQAI